MATKRQGAGLYALIAHFMLTKAPIQVTPDSKPGASPSPGIISTRPHPVPFTTPILSSRTSIWRPHPNSTVEALKLDRGGRPNRRVEVLHPAICSGL